MLSLLETEGQLKRNKCGEIFFEAPTTYNVLCCTCNTKLQLVEFPQHFENHLNTTNQCLVSKVENAEPEITNVNEISRTYHVESPEEGPPPCDLPIEFMEVRLPKLHAKAKSFIPEHVTTGLDCIESAVSIRDLNAFSSKCNKTIATLSPKKNMRLPQERELLLSKKITLAMPTKNTRLLAQRRNRSLSDKPIVFRSQSLKTDLSSQSLDVEMSSKVDANVQDRLRLEKMSDTSSVAVKMELKEFSTTTTNYLNGDINRNKKVAEMKFPCQHCHRSYKSERGLQHHIRVAHEEVTTQSSEKTELKSKEVGNPTSFECNICGKKFSCLGNMNTHRKRHTGEKTFKCSECEKYFFTDHEMKSHMMRHSDQLPVICELCGRGFRNTAKLKGHMLRHTGERPAKCDVCGKCFFSNHDLNVHRATHTTERPFSCEVCGSTFRTKKALRVHKKLHISERAHQCQLCGKAFVQPSGLYSHMQQVHMKGYNIL